MEGPSPRHASGIRLAWPIAALLAAIAAPGARADNGLAAISQSARSVGRGGAEAAIGDDVLTSTSNPALLIETPHIRVDAALGASWDCVRETDHEHDRLHSDFFHTPRPAFGVAWDPLASDDRSAIGSDLRLGFTFWLPMQFVMAPSLGAAWRATDALSLGLAVNVLYTRLDFALVQDVGGPGGGDDFQAGGKMFIHRRPDGTPVSPPEPFTAGTGTQVRWQEIFDLAGLTTGDPNAPAPTVRVRLKNVQGAGIGGQLGALYAVSDDLKIGAGLRSPGLIFRPRGHISIDLTKTVAAIRADPQITTILQSTLETYLPDAGQHGFVQEYDFEIEDIRLPLVAVGGAAWMPTPRWLLALDLRYIDWANAFEDVKIVGRNGTNADFNEIIGGSTLRYKFRMNWRDQYVVALGASFAATESIALRAGWNHGTSAVPDDFLSGNALGTLDHATAGASVAIGPADVTLGYIYGLPRRVTIADSANNSEQHIFYLGVGWNF